MRQTQPVVPNGGAQSNERAPSRPSTISRFLAREKRLRLVVNELGHRAKNLLAVVQSIASQTAQHSSDLDTFRSAFSQRLGALSRSLDLLIHEGEPGVSVKELVRRQLEPFVNVDGTRIVVTGPCALLNQEATQNLGLALHELATNATKYGALSVPEGGISVIWDLARGDSGSERFRLIWREHNGPPVTPPDHHGFGSMILQRIAAAMLGGNVQHDFDVGGVSWTLETPAAAILSVKPKAVVGVSDR
jgi:two-component sensor histidine kinase